MTERTSKKLYGRCVRCQLFNNLNTLIKGNLYCPIHSQDELDKEPTKKRNTKNKKDLAKIRSILTTKSIIYETIPNTLVTD